MLLKPQNKTFIATMATLRIALGFCFLMCGVQCFEKLLVDVIRTEFLTLENQLWSSILKHSKDNSVDPGIAILKKFREFDLKIQQMPQDVLYGMEVPRQAKGFLFFYSDLQIINDLYNKFRRYQNETVTQVKKDYSEYNREITTYDIVGDILHDEKNNVNMTISRIFDKGFSSAKDNIYYDIFNTILQKGYICDHPTQATQQVFYNFYNLFALTDLKGYIMTQFAYMILRLQETGNYTVVSLKAREDFKLRTNASISNIQGAMAITNGKIYRCDPKIHIEGVTYDQLTQLVQAHIQNEADMNAGRSCTNNCAAYPVADNYGCYDKTSDYCKKMKPCLGKLYNCEFIESHLGMCIAPSHSPRRYDYIKYQSGKTLGDETRCVNRNVNSWFRWFVHCSYCLCFCDQQGPDSDRYFSLRAVKADTATNRVITGMRLIKSNRMFHIQIQEGKLLPYGYIDQNTTKWVPVDPFTFLDRGVYNSVDYYTMSYYSRSLHLDDLEVKQNNYIITGVRFVNDGDLHFRITVTPFDFATGTLHTDKSHEISKGGVRHKITFNRPHIPTYSPPSTPNFDEGQYIQFSYTDLDKDAGQTTIPFLDLQPAYADPAVPLRSAGLYYKGQPGYGGFVGVKVGAYDFKDHMNFDFPDVEERIDHEEIYGVLPN